MAIVISVEVVKPGVRFTLELLRMRVRPVGAETPVNPTVPVNPKLVRVIVEVEFVPARKMSGDGVDALMPKSPETPKVSVTECSRDPLAPDIVTMYVPVGVEELVDTVSRIVPL